MQVAQDVLAHQLGATVGVGDPQAAGLGDGDCLGVAIDRGGRAEDDPPHVGAVHGLQKGQGAANVVVKVAQGLSHRLANGLETGKVDHPVDGMLGKDPVQGAAVTDVGLHELESGAAEFFDSVEHLNAAVAEVVDDHHLLASVQEFDSRV